MSIIIFLTAIQNVIAILLFWQIFSSFNIQKRSNIIFKSRFEFSKSILILSFFFCFLFSQFSSFEDERHFLLFVIITGITFIGFFTTIYIPHNNSTQLKISLTLTGTFFWLCFLTTIKFIPYLTYAWFPLFGFLVITPLYWAIISLSEIRYISSKVSQFSTLKILVYGIVPLLVLQLIMNIYTQHNWEFITLFNPENTRIP